MMRNTMIVLAALLTCGVRGAAVIAAEARTDLDPGDWLILSDFPPFVRQERVVAFKGGNEGNDFFESDPGLVFAKAEYKDAARRTSVTVSILRQVRTEYLLHWIEQEFIRSETGGLLADVSLASIEGNLVFYRCMDSPDCTARIYQWRSAADLDVQVVGGTYVGPGLRTPGIPPTPEPCPEFDEIVRAYLKKYPSSLPPYPSEEEREKRWCRDEVRLVLAATKYRIALLERVKPAELTDAQVSLVNSLVREFLRKRFNLLRVRPADGEPEKIDEYRRLSPPEHLARLKQAAAGYEAWWNRQDFGPLVVPALPPP